MNNKIVLFFLTFLSLSSIDAMEPIERDFQSSLVDANPGESDFQKKATQKLVFGCEWEPSLLSGSYRPHKINYFIFEKKVKKFSEKGMDLNAATRDGYTPLIRAAEMHDIKRCKILLKYGADINAITDQFTVVSAAAIHHFDSIAPDRILKFLIAHGADINKPAGNGKTPLMRNVLNRYPLDFLLNLGANPLIGDHDGNNAIFHGLIVIFGYRSYQNVASLYILKFLIRQKRDMVSSPTFFTFLCCLKRVAKSGSELERSIASAMYLNRKKIWGTFMQSLPSLSDALNFVNNKGQTVYKYYHEIIGRKFPPTHDRYDPASLHASHVFQTEQMLLRLIWDEHEREQRQRVKTRLISDACTCALQ